MVFSSPVFLFAYLPLTLAVYYLMPLRWRNLALFLLSLVFYGWDKPIYIPVMLFSVTVSYLCGFPIGKYRDCDFYKSGADEVLAVWGWGGAGILQVHKLHHRKPAADPAARRRPASVGVVGAAHRHILLHVSDHVLFD